MTTSFGEQWFRWRICNSNGLGGLVSLGILCERISSSSSDSLGNGARWLDSDNHRCSLIFIYVIKDGLIILHIHKQPNISTLQNFHQKIMCHAHANNSLVTNSISFTRVNGVTFHQCIRIWSVTFVNRRYM